MEKASLSRKGGAAEWSADLPTLESEGFTHSRAPLIPDAVVSRRFSYRVVKRLFDLVGAATGLVLLSPVLLVLIALIRATSSGPSLYSWNVIGRGGRPFRGYKLRTMVVDADDHKVKLLAFNEMRGPVFKMRGDPRITPIGRFLRKYSLDELPQLWSVLKGDMSLVGPRPVGIGEWPGLTSSQRAKLSVTPGITCLWQVNGRNGIAHFDEWVRLDMAYIETWSLWLDVRIILRTIVAVAKGTGR